MSSEDPASCLTEGHKRKAADWAVYLTRLPARPLNDELLSMLLLSGGRVMGSVVKFRQMYINR
jgi:hypothetical protein